MASKKPLVFNTTTGKAEQLQSGDTLDAAVSSARQRTVTNNNAGSITICQAVYLAAADAVDLAQANASGTSDVVGLVVPASIAASGTGAIITNGQHTATTGQWDAVTGQTGGLTPGSKYFLDKATAGKLTPDISAYTTGDFVCEVGRAFSTTVMEVEPQFVAKL